MRLTRRTFIMASGGTAAWFDHRVRDGTRRRSPARSSPRKARPAARRRATGWPAPARAARSGARSRSSCRTAAPCACAATRCRKTNHGYVCPRGHLIPQQIYDPDRDQGADEAHQSAAKGRGIDPKFVPITWDEALDTVADKMIELRKNNEAHKLAYMRGRYSPTSTDLLYGTLPKIFGTTNYFSHSAICAEAEKMGPGLTQGFFGYRDYDLEKTNCLVIWGTDPLASNRMVPNTIHRFHEIVARGTVIAVDPRLSNVGGQGAGVAAGQARAPTARWPARSPMCC